MSERPGCDMYETGIIQLNLNPEALLQTLLVSGPHPVSMLSSAHLTLFSLCDWTVSSMALKGMGSESWRPWLKKPKPMSD